MRSRREILRTTGGAAALALAGCIHEDDDGLDVDADIEHPDEEDNGEDGVEYGDWPMYGADARNTGVAHGGGPSEAEVSTVDVDHPVNSSVAVVDGVAYLGDTDGVVHAFEDGERLWSFDTGERIRSSAAVADDLLYIGNDAGVMYCLDARTGDEEWDFEAEDRIRSQPTVADGELYFGSHDSNLYKFDAEWGDHEWTYETDSEIRTKPAVLEDSVYVTTRGGNLHRVWREDGGNVRTTSQGNDSRSSPAVTSTERGHVAYFGTEDGNVHAVRFYMDAGIESREKLWQQSTEGSVRTSPAVLGNRVFVGGDDGTMYALDRGSGTVVWRFETEEEIRSSPAVDGERVYFGGVDDSIYAVSVSDGEEVWSVDTEGSVRGGAAVAGSVYLASVDRNMYVVS